MKFSLENELTNLVTARASIMIMGPPFSGKTTSLWTLTKYGRMLVYDFDEKCTPLILKAKSEGKLNQLEVHRYIRKGGNKLNASEHMRKQTDTYMEFMLDVNRMADNVDGKTGDWKTEFKEKAPAIIVIDSLTSFQDHILEFVMAKLGHDLGATDTHSGADYAKQQGKIMEVIKTLKSFPCIFVLICHEQILQDSVTNVIRVLPMTTGKLAEKLAKEFDIVLHAVTRAAGQGKLEYVWETAPTGKLASVGSTFKIGGLGATTPQDFKEVL